MLFLIWFKRTEKIWIPGLKSWNSNFSSYFVPVWPAQFNVQISFVLPSNFVQKVLFTTQNYHFCSTQRSGNYYKVSTQIRKDTIKNAPFFCIYLLIDPCANLVSFYYFSTSLKSKLRSTLHPKILFWDLSFSQLSFLFCRGKSPGMDLLKQMPHLTPCPHQRETYSK